MAIGYTKEFLIEAYLYRFESIGKEVVDSLRILAEKAYAKYGKDEFRKLSSLDADAIKIYKQFLKDI